MGSGCVEAVESTAGSGDFAKSCNVAKPPFLSENGFHRAGYALNNLPVRNAVLPATLAKRIPTLAK